MASGQSPNQPQYRSVRGRTLKIPIAKLGVWEHPTYKYVAFTQKDFDDIKRNFDENETGFEPYLRYGHSMYPGAADGEPSNAWLHQVKQEGDVLFGYFEPNNDTVVNEIKGGKYRYASAELTRNALSKELGKGNVGSVLTAVALTNAPFVPDLPENQVLSGNPQDSHFFVLNQKEIPMPNQVENQTGVVAALKAGFGQILQLLSTNPMAAGTEGRNGDLPKLAPEMQALKTVAERLSQGEGESPEHYSSRVQKAKSEAFEAYAQMGKTHVDFDGDVDQVCSMMAAQDEKYTSMAQALTASPYTSTPVYMNGKLVKGRPNQDNGGQKVDLGGPEGVPAGETGVTGGAEEGGAVRHLSTKTSDPDNDGDGGPSSQEMSGGASEANGDPKLLSQTGADADPKLLSQAGAKANGDPKLLSANGGTTKDYRPLPAQNPLGAYAYLLQNLSNGADAPSAAPAKTEQLSQTAAGSSTAGATTVKEEDMAEMAELQAKVAEMEQKLSNTATLEAQLVDAQSKLAVLAQQAAASEANAQEIKLSQRADELKAAGVPPVLVDEAVAVVKGTGFDQKLSVGGADANLADVLFGLLDKLPAAQRVPMRQVGAKQVLSASTQTSDNEAFVFEGVIQERMGA